MFRTRRNLASTGSIVAIVATFAMVMLLPAQAGALPPPPPQTTITAGPTADNLVTDRTPTFRFRSDVAGAAFECRIDAGAWSTCASPYTTAPLVDGRHEFEVRAVVGASVDPTPAHRRFVLDHDFVPDTVIDSGPGDGTLTSDPTPTFGFSATTGRPVGYPLAGTTTFACSVDAGAWQSCTSPYTTVELADGLHTFAVRAAWQDHADPSPALRTFHVDRGIPDTSITGGPVEGSTTSDDTPTFSFTSTHADATFSCSVDGAAAVACTSPMTTAPLANGMHTFAVAATSGGNLDPTPALRAFTIYVAPPASAGTTTTPGAAAAATPLPASMVRIVTRGARIDRAGRLRIALGCSAGSGECIGQLRLIVRVQVACHRRSSCFVNRTVARTTFMIPSGDKVAPMMKLGARTLRMVRHSSLQRIRVLALAESEANDVQRRILLSARASAA